MTQGKELLLLTAPINYFDHSHLQLEQIQLSAPVQDAYAEHVSTYKAIRLFWIAGVDKHVDQGDTAGREHSTFPLRPAVLKLLLKRPNSTYQQPAVAPVMLCK